MWRLILLCCLVVSTASAGPKQVRVFVALCDNKTQGIIPVGAKIGNGDDPESNLYWGCSDGLGSLFRKSAAWKLQKSSIVPTEPILRQVTYKHASGDIELTAYAYRGSAMKQCLIDFEKAAASGEHDLVAYIGHNGLMDFKLDPPAPVAGNRTEVVVLCCHSISYFGSRLKDLGCRPILMTQQLMYPGAFLLEAAIDSWRQGHDKQAIRLSAAKAYAKNQKISVTAAKGIFAELGQ